MFFSEEAVISQIHKIPHIPDYTTNFTPKQKTPEKVTHLSNREKGRLSTICKKLNIQDNHTATVLENYVKETFNRNIGINEATGQNCLPESVLQQISNTDFLNDSLTGNMYNSQDSRLQTIHYVATNYECIFPLVKDFLSGSFVEYLERMVSINEPADNAFIIELRHRLEVRVHF